MNERQQHLKERDMIKDTEKEEERLWALQAEHMRRIQVLNDRDQKKKLRTVAESTKETHAEQKMEHKIMWKDPYGDRS